MKQRESYGAVKISYLLDIFELREIHHDTLKCSNDTLCLKSPKNNRRAAKGLSTLHNVKQL